VRAPAGSLFARSFPDVTVRPAVIKTLGGVPTADYGWLKSAGGANAAVLIGTLPKYLGGTPQAFSNPASFPEARGAGARAVAVCFLRRMARAENHRDQLAQRQGRRRAHAAICTAEGLGSIHQQHRRHLRLRPVCRDG
jgi:hypothetical protein